MKIEPEPHDDAWELLLKARPAQVRKDFVAGVMQAIANEPAAGKIVAFSPWRWLIPAAAAAVVALGLFFAYPPKSGTPTVVSFPADKTTSADVVQTDGEEEIVGLEDYSALLAVEDTEDLSDADILALLR